MNPATPREKLPSRAASTVFSCSTMVAAGGLSASCGTRSAPTILFPKNSPPNPLLASNRSRGRLPLVAQNLIPVAEQPSIPVPERDSQARRRWFELALVMFLAFSGSLIRSIALLNAGPSSPNQIAMARWIEAGAHQIGILFLVGSILRQSGRTFRDIGFRWSLTEATEGLWLYVAAYAFYRFGAVLIHVGYLLFSGSPPHYVDSRQIFGHMSLFALPFWLLNPFYEEIVVRA